jgi:hypothetical protein
MLAGIAVRSTTIHSGPVIYHPSNHDLNPKVHMNFGG